MDGRYALDTNVVIALIDGEKSIRERIVAANEVFVPGTVLGELYFGAFHSHSADKNVAAVDTLARTYAILPVDETTARIYGEIRNQLRAIGRPIPENDVWIAALVRQWSLTLATRDSHFDAVNGLSIETW